MLDPPDVPCPEVAKIRGLSAGFLTSDGAKCTCDDYETVFALLGKMCGSCKKKPTGTAVGKYLRVLLGETHIYGLLDSGSNVSVIHPRVLGDSPEARHLSLRR